MSSRLHRHHTSLLGYVRQRIRRVAASLVLLSFVQACYAGTNPPLPEIRQMLVNAGQEFHIPPHILFGIAHQESRGWRQFRDDGSTVISGDGGIGVMQLTGATAAQFDVERLKTDIAYNIWAGAKVLNDKWNGTPYIGDNNRAVLENWYYSIWAYNGKICTNGYPTSVLSFIAQSPLGQWDPVVITPIPAYAVTCYPWPDIPTPTPINMDADYDGTIDGGTPPPPPPLVVGDWALTQNTAGVLKVRNGPNGTDTGQRLGDGVLVHIEQGPESANGIWWYRHDHGGWSAYAVGSEVYMVKTIPPPTDISPPSIDLSPGDTGQWFGPQQTISWNITDDKSGVAAVEYWWNEDYPTNAEATGTIAMREGTNVFHIRAGDGAGNAGQVNRTFNMDATGPNVPVSGPAASTWLNTPSSVSWNVTDGGSGVAGVSAQWDSGSETPVPANGSVTIPEGKHSLILRAVDVVGNTTTISAGPFWLDVTPPTVEAVVTPSAPDGQNGWYINAPSVSLAATDPNGAQASGVAGLFYTLDNEPETAFTTSLPVSTDGSHTMSARVVDAAGNTASIVPVTIRVDTTAPVVSSLVTDARSGSQSVLAASWTGQDETSGVAEYEYWIGSTPGGNDVLLATSSGETPSAYAVNLNLTTWQSCYVTVRVRDMAGSWSVPNISSAIRVVPGTSDLGFNANTGGNSDTSVGRASTNYRIVDSFGQFVVDTSSSAKYAVESGYWHSESVVTAFGMNDLLNALRISGGLMDAQAIDRSRLDVVAGTSSGKVDLSDAVRIARKIAGLEANP